MTILDLYINKYIQSNVIINSPNAPKSKNRNHIGINNRGRKQ